MSDKKARNEGKRPARRSTAEINDLKTWLAGIELGAVRPSVHVNGHQHPSALVVVDIGSPLKPVRLSSDQLAELGQRLRRVAKEVLNRDANVRVSADHSHGIHWVSLA